VVRHLCNLNNCEVEGGESQVQGEPGLQNETLSPKKVSKSLSAKQQKEFCN
jgi:hypothetical protein